MRARDAASGHDFLRHVERCAALVHVIDCATYEPGRDPLSDLDTIEAELQAHGGLEDRPRLVALNKIDVPDASEIAEMVTAELEERGLRVFPISTAEPRGPGGAEVRDGRDRRHSGARSRRSRTPPGSSSGRRRSGGPEFKVKKLPEDGGWLVQGDKPERWVRQTDFTNAEATGYLADRLNRLGVERRAARARCDGRATRS